MFIMNPAKKGSKRYIFFVEVTLLYHDDSQATGAFDEKKILL